MPETNRSEVVHHAARWTKNILVEVLNNHHRAVPGVRISLRNAISALDNVMHVIDGGGGECDESATTEAYELPDGATVTTDLNAAVNAWVDYARDLEKRLADMRKQ